MDVLTDAPREQLEIGPDVLGSERDEVRVLICPVPPMNSTFITLARLSPGARIRPPGAGR